MKTEWAARSGKKRKADGSGSSVDMSDFTVTEHYLDLSFSMSTVTDNPILPPIIIKMGSGCFARIKGVINGLSKTTMGDVS